MNTIKNIFVTLAITTVVSLLISATNAAATPQKPPASQPHNIKIQTNEGAIAGKASDGMLEYLGIPFAKAPEGALRWLPQVAPAKWRGVRAATKFGSSCPQAFTLGGFSKESDSEDCLYLNVFVPKNASQGANRNARKRPVMVWIPGGGLLAGRADDYNPKALVEHGDVVFVSMNYRLNVFGFFSHPEINREGHAAGNYGLMDQQLALAWVKKNISRFGGDPDNVTLFGESAGGASVWGHIASPTSAGLFHKAIIESSSTLFTTPLAAREPLGVALASAAGCSGAQSAVCLRSLSAKKILELNAPDGPGFPGSIVGRFGRFTSNAFVDGQVLTQPVLTALKSGNFNKVPLLVGTNHDEFTWFVGLSEAGAPGPLVKDAMQNIFGRHFGPNGDRTLAQYPADSYPTPSNALAAAVGDRTFICGSRRGAAAVATAGVPVFAYEFNVVDAPVSWPKASFPYLSHHTSELQFIFPMFHGASGQANALPPAQELLSSRMVDYWTSFARSGRPESIRTAGPMQPAWDTYAGKSDNFYSLETGMSRKIENFGVTHRCDFWDGIDG